jgi:pyruvate/2-oxoglutarate dehydrogenase complex dihydrolipoamide dehydrogenase (E3) component
VCAKGDCARFHKPHYFMSDSYDFVVIGGGSAGYAGASAAARMGLHTAVIEGAREIGGLCILRGCMPSKTLLESAHRAEAIRHAGEFGLRAEYFGANALAIRARKRRLIGEFADFRRGQLAGGAFDFIRGHAAWLDSHTIEVRLLDGGLRRIQARTALIATGSLVQLPPIPGLADAGCKTSDDILDAGEYPDTVCVLGGGAIALELASFFNGIGVPTTVIQRSAQVLREMDEDVARELTVALRNRGITIHLDTRIERIEREGAVKRVHFLDAFGKPASVEAMEIVCALGRRPCTDGLGLEKAGIRMESGRILADAEQCAGPAHLFAAGDVCGPHEVVHLAIEQGLVSARNAARHLGRRDGPPDRMDYALKLFAVFTHPQTASVGLTEREAAEAGIAVSVARHPFGDHGKSLIRGELDGFVKLIAERSTGRIVGGSCVGPEASELIHEIVVAMRFGATVEQLATTPHYHPTLSEIWTYPAEELAEQRAAS